MNSKPRVLFVDDEPDLLQGVRLSLRKHYEVSVAESGAEALALLATMEAHEPIEVVVSDMRMPQMSGAEFLTAVRRRHPDVPRLLLTGQADVESAVAAVNDAKIFRFLTKPCPPELLVEAIDEAIEHAHLRWVEQELLDETLSGTVNMLTDVLGLVSAGAYSRTVRVFEIVTGLCAELERSLDWDLALAAKLSQIGCVVVNDSGSESRADEIDNRHVQVAGELLVNIPRLEPVAHMVSHQLDATPPFESRDRTEWGDDQLNVETLRVAVQFDRLVAGGLSRRKAVEALAAADSSPPSFIIDALRNVRPETEAMVEIDATTDQLAAGMQLTSDVVAHNGPKLAGAGMTLTSALIGRIGTFAASHGVVEPISVLARASTVRERTAR